MCEKNKCIIIETEKNLHGNVNNKYMKITCSVMINVCNYNDINHFITNGDDDDDTTYNDDTTTNDNSTTTNHNNNDMWRPRVRQFLPISAISCFSKI